MQEINRRLFNTTRQYWVNRKEALKGFDRCAYCWDENKPDCIRDMTIAEQLLARNAQAKLREPLEYAELPGIVFRPPVGQEKANNASGILVWEAHKFLRES